MRISDWSSDVCSSDLGSWCPPRPDRRRVRAWRGGRSRPAARAGEGAPGLYRHRRRRKSARGLQARGEHPEARGEEGRRGGIFRSEEHTSEIQSLMRISYDVFCLKKTKKKQHKTKK